MIDLSDERRQLKEAGLKSSQLYKIISDEIQQKARRDKNDHIKKLCQELEDHSQSNSTVVETSSDLWKTSLESPLQDLQLSRMKMAKSLQKVKK